MLVFLIKIGRVAVDQIVVVTGGIVEACCRDLRNTANMVHMRMRTDNEVQMGHAQNVYHILGHVLTVAHGNLV